MDIGTGSGILAIAAAKLGYSPIDAFDHDPAAIRVSRQNVQKNRVRVRLARGDLARLPRLARRRFDVVCANLICDLLSPGLHASAAAEPGGKLVVAGILAGEFRKIRKKFQRFNLTLEQSKLYQEWKSGRFALV